MGLGFVLDTDIVILALKGKQEVEEFDVLGQQGKPIYLSTVSLFEVWDGIYGSKVISFQEGKRHLEEFLEKFITKIFSVDGEVAQQAGKIRSQLRQSGNLIANPDILIAATCLANDLTLVTRNKKHFSRIKELRLF